MTKKLKRVYFSMIVYPVIKKEETKVPLFLYCINSFRSVDIRFSGLSIFQTSYSQHQPTLFDEYPMKKLPP